MTPSLSHDHVEGGAWRKSSRSAGGGNNCVEARNLISLDEFQVRDSKAPELGHLDMATADWHGFLKLVRK